MTDEFLTAQGFLDAIDEGARAYKEFIEKDKAVTDEEIEAWEAQRIAAIRANLRDLCQAHPEYFWEEIDAVVAQIVMGCSDVDDRDWPEDLHLGDVIEKHLVRHMHARGT